MSISYIIIHGLLQILMYYRLSSNLEGGANDRTTHLDMHAQRIDSIIAIPFHEALLIIATGPVENMIGGIPGAVAREVQHTTETVIGNHSTATIQKIMTEVNEVRTSYYFMILKILFYRNFQFSIGPHLKMYVTIFVRNSTVVRRWCVRASGTIYKYNTCLNYCSSFGKN